MAKIEIFDQTLPQAGTVFDELKTVSKDRQAVIKTLVDFTEKIIPEIEVKQKEKLILSLENRTSGMTDAFGYILQVRQRFIDEEFGFPEEDDDPYFSSVATIEISELDVNGGNLKVTLWEANDENGKTRRMCDGFGYKFDLTPQEYVLFVQTLLKTGNSRPTIEA